MRIKDLILPNKKYKFISVHCSDSDYPQHDNVETIDDWHINGNKWTWNGYHFVVTKKKPRCNRTARPLTRAPAAVQGHNTGSLAICLTGKRKFLSDQFKRTRELIKHIYDQLGYAIPVYPHRYFDKHRTCPNFDVRKELGLNTKYFLK